MDLDKIKDFREEEARKKKAAKDKAAQLGAVYKSGDKVAKAVYDANQQNMSHRANTETSVRVTNPDLAKTKDAEDIVESIDKLNLTTFMTASGGLSGITDNLSELTDKMSSLHGKFREQGLDSLSKQLDPLVKRLETVATQLKDTKIEVDSTALSSINKASKDLNKTIKAIDWQPQINVSQPDVQIPPLDLQSLLKPLANVEKAIKSIEIPKTNIDMKPVVAGLQNVVKTISNLSFPVPNYILPFKDSSGKAVQAQLDSSGSIPISSSSKTILSAGGSASSSGNNTLVAAGTNRLKVCAFSLTTTSTTAMTCIFQSGAGGTELWRVILQAISGSNSGANLSVDAPAWLFSTASATLLNLNLSSANAVHWSVSYFDEA